MVNVALRLGVKRNRWRTLPSFCEHFVVFRVCCLSLCVCEYIQNAFIYVVFYVVCVVGNVWVLCRIFCMRIYLCCMVEYLRFADNDYANWVGTHKKNRVMHCCDWFTLSFDYIYSIKQTVIKISDNQTKKTSVLCTCSSGHQKQANSNLRRNKLKVDQRQAHPARMRSLQICKIITPI